ncbi:MAG: DUF5947 family protein [Acidimicrobiales bacterium]
MSDSAPAPGVLAVLQRIRQPAPSRPGERCEMCTQDVPDDHRHLVDLQDRSLMCVCQACGLLFWTEGAAAGRYITVPDHYRLVVDFELSAQQWDSLQIPVAVAFFFRNSASGATSAFFPSPAGATECLLPLDTWSDVEGANPILASLRPDVEALLVRRGDPGQERTECFIVPIDACYELVGHLRSLWRGFDGGKEVHEQMAEFFERVRGRARPIGRGDAGG